MTLHSLSTAHAAVHFDPDTGLPSSYDLPSAPGVFDGAARDAVVDVTISDDGDVVTTLAASRGLVVVGDTATATFVAGVDRPGAGEVRFSIEYRLTEASLGIALVDVRESGTIELIQVDLARLIALDDDRRDGAWIAHADGGGVFSPLAEAVESTLPYNAVGDFPNLSRLPLVLLGHSRAAVAMRVLGYLSNTAIDVHRHGGVTTAGTGAAAVHRVPGSPTAPSLPVEQAEIARIDLIGPVDGRPPTWLDAARVVQCTIGTRRTDYFDDKFMYAVLGQLGPADRRRPANTFEQIEALIERVARLTDTAPQVVFVAGWNAGGHDTGYPAIGTVNPDLGGEAGWRRLQENARERHSANVTLDDNWDDMYDNAYTAGEYDPVYVARDRDGALQTQERWNGTDLSHITGFAKYLADDAPGIGRADLTIERYAVRDAMLIDAMSWWSVRNDWDPAAPASAVRNLREGKFRLLDHFRDRGVHVGSEVLTYPFVDRLPFTMDGPTGSEWVGFGGTAIPAMALVYRTALIYGAGGGGDSLIPEPATALFHNNRAAKWFDTSTPDDVITSMYYLHYLPWMLLSPLDIVGFERDGSRATIELHGGSAVFLDDETGAARAVLAGETILDGRSVSLPLGSDRIAFYSELGGELSSPVDVVDPARWQVRRLSSRGAGPAPFRIEEGRMIVDVDVCTPVIARVRSTDPDSTRRTS